jgi:hypothetical protein
VLALWFAAGWTFGGFAAWALGLNELIGPVTGFAAAVVILVDPRQPLPRLSGWIQPGARAATEPEQTFEGRR